MTSAVVQAGAAPIALAPLGASNIGAALRLATDSFGPEAAVVALTYLWHFARSLVPADRLMVRSDGFDIVRDDATIGTVWRVSSMIHGTRACWLDVDLTSTEEPAAALLDIGAQLSRRRLAVFRLPAPCESLVAAGAVAVGSLPGAAGEPLWLYAADCPKAAARSGIRLARHRRRPIRLDAAFYVAFRERRPIGFTGIYATDFWPGSGWGGWGGLGRDVAQRRTALALLAATEDQARERGAQRFLIETSDAPRYRAARRIYELYGLELLLRIDDFFEAPTVERPGEAYLVYGRELSAGR